MEKQKIQVVEIKADVPVLNKEFVQVSLGYKLNLENLRAGPPIFKHMIHVFIPKQEWHSQYNMWDEYEITIDDSGNVKMQKITGGEKND